MLRRVLNGALVRAEPQSGIALQSLAKTLRENSVAMAAAESAVVRRGPLTRALLRSTTSLAAVVGKASGGSCGGYKVSTRDVAVLFDAQVCDDLVGRV